PMLAATSADVAAGLADAGGDASVEWKLDGARIQVHRSGEDVAVFTRNLNDVTERLAGVVELARRLPADRFVLDGEILGVAADASGELRPELFQHTMGTFATDAAPPKGGGAGPDTGVRLQAWFFDILHLDGEDQIDRPLRERLAVLEQIAGPFRIPGTITDSSAVAATVARDALAAGHEGVMVKAADSRYEAGRRGRAWRKVKPVHTVDLVVLAVEWGSGRRRGWLSNLHLGARDPASATAQPRFVMVGKTFKGLTDELLAWQTSELLARRTHDEGHVVHVRPELVVEIALDGVQISRRYPGEVALRFARVRRYRTDKSPAEADTIDTLRRLLPGAVAPDQEIP
ncbi:MAG: ATP-dependent DNA ligase, partial [Acidimicrobiia bacterium]|nr:ATP-dependent DNA ligase [Acidimicrobiia bacterium]